MTRIESLFTGTSSFSVRVSGDIDAKKKFLPEINGDEKICDGFGE